MPALKILGQCPKRTMTTRKLCARVSTVQSKEILPACFGSPVELLRFFAAGSREAFFNAPYPSF